MHDVLLKRFDHPDETRTFPKGRFDLVRLGNMVIGRAVYQPGWKWSVDIGNTVGLIQCDVDMEANRIRNTLPSSRTGGRALLSLFPCFAAHTLTLTWR
jgi:hypothetical protein